MDSLIADFDNTGNYETANKLFKVLAGGGLLDEPLQFDSSASPDTLRQQVWYWMAEYYYAAGDYKRSVQYGSQALPLYNVPDESADCLSLLAISHVRLSQFTNAAKYARRCYELDHQSGDNGRISSSLNTLASIYLLAGQPREAEKYVLRGIELARKTDNSMRLAVLCGMASEVYHAQGRDTTALRYINEAYELDSLGERTDRMQTRLAQKASVLIGLHKYAEAEVMLGGGNFIPSPRG